MERPTVSGHSTYPRCGDKLTMFFRIQENAIQEVSFVAKACGPVIAAASYSTTVLVGQTLEEAQSWSVFELHEALGGMPVSKRHALLMVLECVHDALGESLLNTKTKEFSNDHT